MSSSLDVLFEQIIHTEQKAQGRRNLINEVKSESIQCQEKLKDVQEESKVLEGQLILKMQQLSNAEVAVKCLKGERDIQIELKQDLTDKNIVLKKELGRLEQECSTVIETFFSEVESFARGYDLISHGTEARRDAAKQDIKQAKVELEVLEKEINLFQSEYNRVVAAEKIKEEEWQKLEEKKEELYAVESELSKQQQLIKELEEQKDKLAQLPHTDPQFKRLQEELESCRDDTLEGFCAALQQELQELQQQKWQQRMQRQQQHAKPDTRHQPPNMNSEPRK